MLNTPGCISKQPLFAMDFLPPARTTCEPEIVSRAAGPETGGAKEGDDAAALLLLLARNRRPPPACAWVPWPSPLEPGADGSAAVAAAADGSYLLPEELRLSSLGIAPVLPPGFGISDHHGGGCSWAGVRLLSLANNALEGIPDLRGLRNLRVLWLDHNEIHAMTGGLPATLQDLALHDNPPLRALPADLAQCCPELRTLRLDRCSLLLAPPLLRLLPRPLESLHLQGCAGLVCAGEEDGTEGGEEEDGVDQAQARLARALTAQLPRLLDLQLPANQAHFVGSEPGSVATQIEAAYSGRTSRT